MDTSETYIKMCDCPEIQQYKIHRQTDMYLHKGIDGDEVMAGYNLAYVANSIWLPRQDQLQEMLGQLPTETYLVFRLVNWATQYSKHCKDIVYTDYARQFASMEQLWLAFVMESLHKKQWDGDKWI